MTPAAETRRFWLAVLLAWLGASAVVTLACAADIVRQIYPDPDDTMRRLEVRDWLAGQSWWDVSQHRLASGMMHWSRLVDLPLAAVILPLRPLLGEAMAERVAMVIVPLVTLGAALALIAGLTRRLVDEEHARLALLIAPLSVPLIYQMRPMRIDHHGWQVVAALGALAAFSGRRADARSGVIGGALLAILLTISLEGLPIAAALLGLTALAWALDPARRDQMIAATASCFVVALALHGVTRGPLFFAPACDAMAPVWLAVLGAAAAATAAAGLIGGRSMALRLSMLAAGGVACAGVLIAVDRACLAGPFGALDPLVRLMWYDKVKEGLPIWDQDGPWAAMSAGLPAVGLLGAAWAWRTAPASRREAWLFVIAAQIAAFALSIAVSRAAATACAFATPSATLVVLRLLQKARQVPRIVPRVAATAGALLVASPGLAVLPMLTMENAALVRRDVGRLQAVHRAACTDPKDTLALSALPPGRAFAPLDIAPEIVAGTSLRAIASGHHRNAHAMHDVIAGFVGPPMRARQLVAAYHADYVVGCPGFMETSIYAQASPNGFWARLERGERFDWLQPVNIPGSPVLAWRVLPKAARDE